MLKDLLKQELNLSIWDDETYSMAASALAHNTAFTKLRVNGRNKGEAVHILADALETNPALTELDFAHCDMPYGAVARLASALSMNENCRIKHLDFSRNWFSNEDVEVACLLLGLYSYLALHRKTLNPVSSSGPYGCHKESLKGQGRSEPPDPLPAPD